METIEVKVPAIGDYKDVPVIDVLVAPGQQVEADAPLVTLESDKATMDVPSPAAGTVRELKVKVGDRVQEGTVVLTLEQTGEASARGDGAGRSAGRADDRGGKDRSGGGTDDGGGGGRSRGQGETREGNGKAAARDESDAARATRKEPVEGKDPRSGAAGAEPPAPGGAPKASTVRPSEAAEPLEVKVPSIGNYTDVPVIDVLVKAGETVAADAPLVTLESDKATMDVPAPAAGTVRDVKVKVGDRVSEGTLVAVLVPSEAARGESDAARGARLEPAEGRDEGAAAGAAGAATVRPQEGTTAPSTPRAGAEAREREAPRAARDGAPQRTTPAESAGREAAPSEGEARGPVPHASPSIRKFARELGVDLRTVEGSGPKGRILLDDVQRFVKDAMSGRGKAAATGGGLELAPWPQVDFAKWGPVDVQPLSRIRKLSRTYLARNWVMIPHVTQHDEADITELERFRQQLNEEHAREGVKVTLLAFLVKVCVAALKKFPEVNASLDGDQLVLKRYFNIGFAADTPNGLVVPVVHDADRKGVLDIARELAELAAKAREGKLARDDIQGGTFSISSLGGIGGTSFTPIINAPEVAILGVSRSATKPVWDGQAFQPRLVLPLSLSYDHRVVDGALGARFITYVSGLLSDMRRAML